MEPVMEISLQQAIEIHAKALKKRHKHHAPHQARQYAHKLKHVNDHEGSDVWIRVAEVAEHLLRNEPPDAESDA
jgi:hypothetical protein